MTSSVKPGVTGRRSAANTGERLPVVGLLTLSGAMFISMATEFLPSGLIPQISADFGRSASDVGNMVTVFALTVIVTAAPLAILTRRIPRKTMVLISFALIGAGNVVLVLAPSFEFLLGARILGAVGHGAFWTVVSAYPAYLVRPTQLAKAMAITAAGGSVAGVMGTPTGNALGQIFGWRSAFAVLAGLVIVFMLLMVWLLPAVRHHGAGAKPTKTGPVRRDKSVPAILIICVLILMVVSAQISFGTYSVVWLLDVGHLPPAGVPLILFVSGIASAVGVAVTGAFYRKFPTRMFLAALAAQVGILCAIPLAATMNSQIPVWILITVMGAVFGGIPVMLQTRMMQSASVGARNLAAALQTTAFNVGIGGGAFMGGIVIDHLSLTVLPFWAAICMFVAFIAAAVWEFTPNGAQTTRPNEKRKQTMAFMSEHTKARAILDYETGRAALSEAWPEAVSNPEKFGGALDLPIGAVATVFRMKEAVQEKLWAQLSTIEVPDRVEVPPIEPNPAYEGTEVPNASAQVTTPATGQVKETVEITLEGPSHGNPFTDVELHAYFSLNDEEIRVGGFYDGNGRYIIRFLPETAGDWQFRTVSTARSLDGHTGAFRVEPGTARGIVQVAETFHFSYADGEVYRPVGTTLYAWTHQSEALQKKTLETLSNSPFTKVRMCVFPKAFIFNDDNPELYPFERNGEDWDTTRFDPEFFQHFENCIRELGKLGIEADVILFHPYDRWGFQDLGAAADDRYLRYIVRRLAAIPNVWWSLANEYDFVTTKTPEDWERFAKIVTEEDYANHLLSIHNGTRIYDFSAEWATHASLQKVDYYKTAELVEDFRDKWGKPVILDEIGYEGDLEYEWGSISAQEVVRRVWETNLRGGYYTHGETYYRPADELWWAKGGELVGQSADRIAFLDKLVAESPTRRLEPLALTSPTPAGGVAGEYEIHYNGYSQYRYVTLGIPEGREAVIDVIDTWGMTIETLPGTFSGQPRIELPVRPYMAVRVRVNKAS